MAKKRRVNKAAKIREYKEAHPNAMPKEIAAALGKQGIKVTSGAVSTTLSSAKRKQRGGRKLKRGAGRTAGDNGAVNAEAIKAAASLIKSTGSVEGAKKALSAVEAVAKALSD